MCQATKRQTIKNVKIEKKTGIRNQEFQKQTF
jgi:hypothetical protein